MAVAFTRTNQFILGQGTLLITGDLVITTSSAQLTPSDLGVKKFISVLGSVMDGDENLICPVIDSTGLIMTCAPVVAADTQAQSASDNFPVGTYSRLSVIAV